MPKAFSVVSWNVEHFKNSSSAMNTRVNRVCDFIRSQTQGNTGPDVMAIYEVEGKEIYNSMRTRFPGYQFHITEGPQTQEILVGVRGGMDAFFTQKVSFKSGSSYLRPGALLTLRVDNKDYVILFLHTKSGNDPKGFGLRDDMLSRALKFRSTLNSAVSAANGANYIFVGDLNTMGMEYPYKKAISSNLEIRRLKRRTSYYKMRPLEKTHPHTWSNGSSSSIPDSRLDHVVASKHLKFRAFDGGAEVNVVGWPDIPQGAQRDRWIRDYSDHALLYFEVMKL